jgi:hypothetical protein
MSKRERRKQNFVKRVEKLSFLSDLAANNGVLPEKPGISRHRKKDVLFFYGENELGFDRSKEDRHYELEKEDKILL